MRLMLTLWFFIACIISACNLSSPATQSELTDELTPVPSATTADIPTRTPVSTGGEEDSTTTAGSSSTISTVNTGNTANTNPLPNLTTGNTSSSNTGTVICNKQTSWNTYTVLAGDTLFGIAQRGNTTVDTLVSANCLVDAGLISVGQTLYVPNPVQPRPTNPTPTHPNSDPNRYTLELWWIIQGDDGRIGFRTGCGDSIYLQQSGIPTSISVNETINRAFTYLSDDNNGGAGPGEKGWWNPMSTTSLKVDKYSIDGNHVTANLSGQYSLSGVCFDAQLQAQIALNVMHLTRTKSATITINGTNMRDIFNASGMNTKTMYTWDEFQYGDTGNGDGAGRELIEYWVGSETRVTSEDIEVGCVSYLVPIDTDSFVTGNTQADLTTALTALFDPNRNNPSAVMTNFLKDQNLSVHSITINNGNAIIDIAGQMHGIGTCADPVLEGQIIQTIFQFEDIQTAKVMNGAINLREFVDMSGTTSLVDYIYTRSD